MSNDELRLEKKIKMILAFGIINVVYGLIVFIPSYRFLWLCNGRCDGVSCSGCAALIALPLYFVPAFVIAMVFSVIAHSATRKIKNLPGNKYTNSSKDRLLMLKTVGLILLWLPLVFLVILL